MHLFPQVFPATLWMNLSVQLVCTQKQTCDFYKLQISALMQFFVFVLFLIYQTLQSPGCTKYYCLVSKL